MKKRSGRPRSANYPLIVAEFASGAGPKKGNFVMNYTIIPLDRGDGEVDRSMEIHFPRRGK